MDTTIERKFPEVLINTVDGGGMPLSRTRKGVGVNLHLRGGVPRLAEVFDIATGGDNEHALIGLEIDGGALVGYDGVFDLPDMVLEMLQELGIRNEL